MHISRDRSEAQCPGTLDPHLGPWGSSHFLGDVRFTPSQPPPLQLEWQGLFLPVGPEAKAGVLGAAQGRWA